MAPIVEIVFQSSVPVLSLVLLVVIVVAIWLCAGGDNHIKAKEMTKVENFADIQRPETGARLANTLRAAVPVSPTGNSGGKKTLTQVTQLGFNATNTLRSAFKDDKLLTRLTIQDKRLQLTEIIGHGNFGLVYRGTLLDKNMANPRPVAIKTVQGPNCTRRDVEDFVKESARMRDFANDYVLCIAGVAVKDNKPFIVLPFMENGDLKSHISDRRKVLTLEDLTRFGYHVAQGMRYLASKNFVHRDLATRNCMVSADMTVKVADFGLSRDLYQADYYKMTSLDTPLPIRWVALESILTSKFTTKSDVWSYGILLWELFTRGRTPYPDLANNLEVVKFLKAGKRLDMPEYVTPNLAKIAKMCWIADPKNRPDFVKVCGMLHYVLEGEGDYLRPTRTR